MSPKTFTRSIPAAGEAPIPAASNENHAHGEAGRASQSGPSENHIGLDSSRLNPAGRPDHPMKPVLLDLFCKAGGCTKGYQRAGFFVIGCDVEPQPNYCGEHFIQNDALDLLDALLQGGSVEVEGRTLRLDDLAAIHASPPCQAHVKGLGAVNYALGRISKHPDLIPDARLRLMATGLPYVIENVEGAPLNDPIKLCGSSFGLMVRRHRLFEMTFPIMAPPCAHHLQTEKRFWTSVSAHRGEDRHTSTVVQVYGNGGGAEHWPEAMGIDWMEKHELTQAIPPAYTEHIGHYLTAHLRQEAIAA